jgi:hypothetical protein
MRAGAVSARPAETPCHGDGRFLRLRLPVPCLLRQMPLPAITPTFGTMTEGERLGRACGGVSTPRPGVWPRRPDRVPGTPCALEAPGLPAFDQ